MTSTLQLPPGRYGPVPSARRKRVGIIGLATLGLAGLGLALWLGIGMAKTPTWTQEVSYRVVSSELVEVTFDLTKDRDATVICAIQALNQSKAEVGVNEVEIGPRDKRTTREQVGVVTSELATTGIVKNCRVVSE